MTKSVYKIQLSDEKDTFIVVRESHPHLMIHIKYVDSVIEVSKIILMENCSPSELGNILKEFEMHVKDELIPKTGTRAS